MPRTVSATEAKMHLGSIIEWVARQGDDVIIETRGKPTAVLVGYADYQEIQRLRAAARNEDSLRRLEAVAEQMADRNRDLSQEDADAPADRFVREVVEDVATSRSRDP